MKTSLFTLIAIVLISSYATTANTVAKKERRANLGPRLPAMSITEAIETATFHHKKENPEGEEIFVDEAVYVRAPGESYWKVGVRQKKKETGHLYYKITSKKKVSIHSVVKDG